MGVISFTEMEISNLLIDYIAGYCFASSEQFKKTGKIHCVGMALDCPT